MDEKCPVCGQDASHVILRGLVKERNEAQDKLGAAEKVVEAARDMMEAHDKLLQAMIDAPSSHLTDSLEGVQQHALRRLKAELKILDSIHNENKGGA